MNERSLQETYAPNCPCFGCGPANDLGLRLRSFAQDDSLVAQWQPQRHHQAYEGMLAGGIIGALLDCHCNWTAAYFLMVRDQLTEPPCTVTAKYEIELLQPTPLDRPLTLKAWVTRLGNRSVEVEGTLSDPQAVTAKCRGTFVAVAQGHPAYHRW